MITHLKENTEGIDYVVGDVHGYFSLFLDLLEHINFDPAKDRLFSVGDIIDRGPENLQMLSLLDEPWFYMVRGNHEQLMIDGLLETHSDSFANWVRCGGMWYTQLSEEDRSIAETFIPRLNELPHIICVGEKDRFNIVHAELIEQLMSDEALDALKELSDFKYLDRTGLTLNLKDIIIWKRTIFDSAFGCKYVPHEKLSRTFCGHTIVSDVNRRLNHINIDTGLWYNGKLTIINASTLEYTQISRDGQYFNGFLNKEI